MDAEDVRFPAASDKLLLPSAWWFEGQKCEYRGQSIYLPLLGFSGCNCTEQTWSQTDIWCQSEAWHLSLSYRCREAWLHSGFFTGNVTANHYKEPLVALLAEMGSWLPGSSPRLLLFLSLCMLKYWTDSQGVTFDLGPEIPLEATLPGSDFIHQRVYTRTHLTHL